MFYTINIGGPNNMYSRYYIKRGKIYFRYNRKTPLFGKQKLMKGLRESEIKKAVTRQKILMILISIILCVAITYLAVSIFFMYKKNTDTAIEYEKLNIEEISFNIDNNFPDSNIIQDSITIKTIENKTFKEEIKELKEIEKIEEDKKETTIETSSMVYNNEDYQVMNLTYIQNAQSDILNIAGHQFIKKDLPSIYYPNIDFSTFQPGEPYQMITNKNSPAYQISHSENAYTDENGIRRYVVSENEFKVDNKDDYIVGMGTFYKTKGEAGERFLIETTTGRFTVRIGDEKADEHTDKYNMFTLHGKDLNKAGIIEFIYDENSLHRDILAAGTFFNGPDKTLSGEIVGIYKIL